MSRILVTGAGSGLGAALVNTLKDAGHIVHPFDHSAHEEDPEFGDVRRPEDTYGPCPNIDVLINCAGVNITGWLDDFSEAQWDLVMDTNAKGIFKMTQWAYEPLRRNRGTVLNIVSNASHMPMTTSLAYNASKGAAHIMTLQLARELTKKNGITVFGISPNKLKGTGMSRDIEEQVVKTRGWTAEFAEKYQRDALLCGEETDPMELARFIRYLLTSKAHHKFLTGCVLPYGA